MQKARKHPENGDINKNLPHFEQLEPRVMLSADSLLNVTEPDPGQSTLVESTQEVFRYAECSETFEQIEGLVQSGLTKSDDY